MYAIVRTGGKQYKVAEGDVITVEKLAVSPGATVTLTPLLVVDGESRTLDADALAAANVTAEVVAQTKGPKIKIHKFKNKTGYHKRMGHRQKLTEVRITSVSATAGPAAPAPSAAPIEAIVTTDSRPADAVGATGVLGDAAATDTVATSEEN